MAMVVPSGFLYGVTNLVSLSCFTLSAEIIDDNWIRTGVRSDGVIQSCVSFSTKLGNAIGGSIGILALSAVGYVANVENLGADVLTKMDMVINFAPASFYIVATILFLSVGMTKEKAKANEVKIAELIAQGKLK